MAWLTVQQTARLLHVRSEKVREFCATDPDFPCIQSSPHRWRIAESALDRWVAARHQRDLAEQGAPDPQPPPLETPS